MAEIFPIILSGGTGTRLWPLSRACYPKQFIRFSKEQDLSFLQAACMRLPEETGFQAPTLLCNEDHRFVVRDQLEAIGVAARRIILEPVARNTAPAVTVAAASAIEDDPDAVLAVMPSDHVIGKREQLAERVKQAAAVAGDGALVLFGVEASRPDTGYGYIRRGDALNGQTPPVYSVDAFVEKPDEETARSYLDQGCYYWNSGIFVFQARMFLDEIARLEPDMLAACRSAFTMAEKDLGFLRLDKSAFANCPDVSVDVAVIERTTAAAMLPLDAEWSDVGSWSSLLDLAGCDEDGNAVVGTAFLEDTCNCYLHSCGRVLSAIGVENLIVVDTPDATLVADASRS
ncbi:MAG: mannose-1-phosphate guanylyltransferase/mannose-6-phosphate isomerase [Methyloligellaceae bacterium]